MTCGVVKALVVLILSMFWPIFWSGACDSPAGQLFAQEPVVPPQSILAQGIRIVPGEMITLYTDLPASEEVDRLPEFFRSAVSAWSGYFRVAPNRLEKMRLSVCLIQDKDRFRRCGLLTNDLPPFENGFQRGDQIWLYEQPTDYYRRHLLLHEGTHAVTWHLFKNLGPSWYREGLAEWFSTHRYADSTEGNEQDTAELKCGYFPLSREEVPGWGRIKLIRDDLDAGRRKTIRNVLSLEIKKFKQAEAYAWTWALTTFFLQHPQLEPVFRQLDQALTEQNRRNESFSTVSLAMLGFIERDEPNYEAAWQIFLHQLDYGYDFSNESLPKLQSSADVTLRPRQVSDPIVVEADRGWQSAGIHVRAGQIVEFAARGRYELGRETVQERPVTIWCEPAGVTFEYYQSRSVGKLLGAIVSPEYPAGFAEPFGVGDQSRQPMPRDGELFFRINERSDRMRDNRGRITVYARGAAP